jgi:hypothetical protein
VTHEPSAVLFKLAGIVALRAIPLPAWFLALAVGPITVAALAGTASSFGVYRRVAVE